MKKEVVNFPHGNASNQNWKTSHQELAVDLPNFVRALCTHPDLICICSNKELLDELDRVLLVQSPTPQLLSYDTTFQLGDFYVSTLAFRHTLFKEAPVIPLALLIHERKLQACHDELFGT